MTLYANETDYKKRLDDLFDEVRGYTTPNGSRTFNIDEGRTVTISMPDTADQINAEYTSKEGEGISEPLVTGLHIAKRKNQRYGHYTVTVVYGGNEFQLFNNGSHGIAISRGPQNYQRQELKKLFAECKIDTVAVKAAIVTRQHPDFSQVVARTTYEEAKRGIFN